MGFEDTDDFWHRRGGEGGDGRGRSKLGFLQVLVTYGAVATARGGGVEVPYDGALAHAELLELEGYAVRSPEQPIAGAVIWVPTDAGRRAL